MASDNKALDAALASIEKQFGKGSLMKLGDNETMNVAAIPTGALSLDLALGIGGVPRGRVTEIYGPESSGKTTVALHIVAEAQRAGGIAAFIDAEHALDPVYARAVGVDVNELLVSQPDNGEQALEITDMLVRSGSVDVIVVDSVSALTPRAEIEGEMGDSHVGLQARLMSQALRKLAGSLNRSRTSLVFINQLREKIGVMFGCMSHDTRVTLADGTQERIGEIVEQRMDAEVLSYDPDTGEFSPRRIVDWFDNGTTEEFLTFTVDRPTDRGPARFRATANHLVATPSGWLPAGELRVGDRVVQQLEHHLGEQQWEVLLGGLMGGGRLSPSHDGHAARFRWGHGARQAAYGDWKASLFANVDVTRSTSDRTVRHELPPLVELGELRRAVYVGGGKVLNHDYLKALTPLALAIWYQDAGRLEHRGPSGSTARSIVGVGSLEPGSRRRLRDHLDDTHGVEARLSGEGDDAVLRFTPEATRRFHELIARYVHPSMEHVLLPSVRGCFDVEPVTGTTRAAAVPMPISSIVAGPPEDGRTHRYDLEIEGNHTYLVDHVAVHNSPETTSGGRALKFYSSVRLDVRRIETLKDGSDMVGNRVRVKVAKNKVAPPFRKAEFDIMYGEGISREGSLLDIGVDEGFIRKAGAWYTYDGEQLGQGRENARNYLKEHEDMARDIEKRVLDKVGIAPLAAEEKADEDEDGEEE